MKKKSVIALLLTISIISFVLFGCTNSKPSEVETSSEEYSNEVIEKKETIFKSGRDFSEGVAWVNNGTLIDSSGKILFSLKEDEFNGKEYEYESPITNFVNGVALTTERLIDKNNNTLFDVNKCEEGVMYSFLGGKDFLGYAFVRVDTNTYDTKSTKVGVLDPKGNWYKEPCEEFSRFIINGPFPGQGYVSSSGYGLYYAEEETREKGPLIYNVLTNETSNDEKMFEKWKKDYQLKYNDSLIFNGDRISTKFADDTLINSYFSDANGNRVIDLSKYHIFSNLIDNLDHYYPIFSEGYCALELYGADSETHFVTIIDKNGNEQFSPVNMLVKNQQKMTIGVVSKGLLATPNGYMNIKGEIVIPKENDVQDLGDFSQEGIAKVTKTYDKGVYYIDTTGKIVF